jgi:hypothetical protein
MHIGSVGNDANSIRVQPGLSGGGAARLSEIAERAASGLLAIAAHGSVLKDKQASVNLLIALNAVVSVLRECEIEIDPNGLFGMHLHLAATDPNEGFTETADAIDPNSQ